MESRGYTCEIIALGNNCLAALLKNGKIIILTRPNSKTEDWHSDTLPEHKYAFSIAALSNQQFVTVSRDSSTCIWTLKDNRWHQEKIESIKGLNLSNMFIPLDLISVPEKGHFYTNVLLTDRKPCDAVLHWTKRNGEEWSFETIIDCRNVLGISYPKNQYLLVIASKTKDLPRLGWVSRQRPRSPASCIMAWTDQHPAWEPLVERYPDECTYILPNGSLLLKSTGEETVLIMQPNSNGRWKTIELIDLSHNVTCQSNNLILHTVLSDERIVTLEKQERCRTIRIWEEHNNNYLVTPLASIKNYPGVYSLMELSPRILALIFDNGMVQLWDLNSH